MNMPEPIYPELVEKIKEEYRRKMDHQADETVRKTLQTLCDLDVAAEIGRLRQEAIAKGGELGARIKAENDAIQKELEAQMDPKLLAEIKERRAAAEAAEAAAAAAEKAKTLPKFCPNCGTPIRSGKFCPNCGTKLI